MRISRTILLITGLSVAAVVLLLIALGMLTKSNIPSQQPPLGTSPTPSVTNGNTAVVLEKIIPDPSTVLEPGKPTLFTFIFTAPVSLSNISFTVTQTGNGSNTPSRVQATVRSPGPYTISLLLSNILPRSIYEFIAKDHSGNSIADISYTTLDEKPTPVPSNNNTLQKYLPYNAQDYTLEYDPQGNIYIFHFIDNVNSNDDIATQFDKAQADATQFIQSKGVDINSIIIDWRHN